MDTMENVKRMSLTATVIRADGTTEELGILALYDQDENTDNIGQIKAYPGLIEESCE